MIITRVASWADRKRPITATILNLLDFAALARAADMESAMARVLAERQLVRYTEGSHQQLLFRENTEEYGVDPESGNDELAACNGRRGAPR